MFYVVCPMCIPLWVSLPAIDLSMVFGAYFLLHTSFILLSSMSNKFWESVLLHLLNDSHFLGGRTPCQMHYSYGDIFSKWSLFKALLSCFLLFNFFFIFSSYCSQLSCLHLPSFGYCVMDLFWLWISYGLCYIHVSFCTICYIIFILWE